MRLAQTQVWPALRNLQIIAPSTAASRSASSKTMKGALPPSSIDMRFIVPAHWAMSSLPTAVEPVNVSLRTVGLEVSSLPISTVWPQRMLITPGGMPARVASSASAWADRGVSLAGLHTTVQPAARAGPIFRASMALGKFHGVMQATTPTGCLMQTMRLSLEGLGDGVAVHPLGLFREPLDVVGAVGDLPAGLGQGLALLRGQNPRQVFLVLHHQVEPAPQQRGALLDRGVPPVLEGPGGGLDRAAGFGRGRNRRHRRRSRPWRGSRRRRSRPNRRRPTGRR